MSQFSNDIPEVFIVESMHEEEEEVRRFDGKATCDILELHGKRFPRYRYIRTKQELREMARLFRLFNYRYLHISCHGDEQGLELRLEGVSFTEFADIFAGYLNGKRLFVSACSVGVKAFAKEIFRTNPDCFSVVAPEHDLGITESAIFWSAFYYLMHSENRKKMTRKVINQKLTALSKIFPPKMQLFVWDELNGKLEIL